MTERERWKNWRKESKKDWTMLPLLLLLFIPGGAIVAGIWFFVWGIRESDRMAEYSRKSYAEFCERGSKEGKL
jgi:hypothetical protein